MRNISVVGSLPSDPVLGPRVERATEILEEVMGPTTTSVDAEWSAMRDATGQLTVQLVLSDSTGVRVEARFEPGELARDAHLRAKFYRIWGDFLEYRSHKQLDALSGRIGSGE
jgi:hypothetical protein